MTEENAEKLGRLSDTLDNITYTAKLPMPAEFHLPQLIAHIEKARDTIRKVVIEETGENPWGDEVDLTEEDDD